MSDMPRKIFIVAGEDSGDQLGAALMSAMHEKSQMPLKFDGVGGEAMTKAGLSSLFDMQDIAVMGFSAVIARLPSLVKRINQTANAAIASKPDALIIIDSPDFTHRVARKVRAKLPNVPVINYVCPSVWAWRQGRAQKMTSYIDHVLAILPFEPDVLRDLKGPEATFVGHPLASSLNFAPKSLNTPKRTLLVLPGSRSGEVKRLMTPFKETVEHLSKYRDDFDVIIPSVPGQESFIKTQVSNWRVKPKVTSNLDEKKAAFQKAVAALTASGTVCLELALAGVPMLSAYKLDPIARQLRFLVKTWSANLPNLIVDYPAVPEYIDEFVRPEMLARSLNRLLSETPQRQGQILAFNEVRQKMVLQEGETPSQKAAETVLKVISEK